MSWIGGSTAARTAASSASQGKPWRWSHGGADVEAVMLSGRGSRGGGATAVTGETAAVGDLCRARLHFATFALYYLPLLMPGIGFLTSAAVL